MPDVGILNLQIHDDSAKAADGLSKLVAKLKEMKDATSKIRLGTVATGIKRINDELSKVQPSAIFKLKQLADVLEKIGSISGNVGGIRISFGGRGQNAEDMAAQMQAARDAVAQTTAGFEQIGQHVQEGVQGAEAFANTMGRVNEIVQQTGWTAQATAEQFAQMFQVMNSIRMSGALGGGASPFALGDGTGGSGADWTYWKDGAIEVEGTVSDAAENIYGYIEGVQLRLTGVVEETKKAAKVTTSEYKAACEEALKDAQKLNSEIANKVRALPKRTIEDYYHGMRFKRQEDGTDKKVQVKDVLTDQLRGMGTPNEQLYAFQTVAKELGMTVEEVKAKIEELKAAEAGIGDQATQGIDSLNSSLSAAEKFTEKARNALEKIKEAASELKGGFSKLFPTITSLVKGFGRIAKYRMLRAILRQITAGISEGVQNVYFYSKAVGTSLAPAMDSAASALLQMKNSIGAALAPLIESLVPVLQTVVNWFITAVNYANQFFALIRGQKTWTRAVPATTKAFDDQTKAAKGAGAAIKDLLADWDELNIIQSESGGGGSIGATENATDYLNMFEEVDRYEDTIKRVVDGINSQFGDIWELVKKIGIAIGGWKMAYGLAGWLAKLGGWIATGAIIDIVFNVTELLDEQYFKTGDIGWVIADVLQTALGAYLANKVMKKVLGAGAGKVAAGVTLAVSAVADIIALAGNTDVTALSTEGIVTAIKSGLKLGGGMLLFSMAAGVPAATAITAASGAASIGIGAAIAIKAVAEAAQQGEVTFENVKAAAAGAVAAGLGVTVFEMIGGAALGTALAAGGAATLAIGAGVAVALGIVASIGKDKVEWGDVSLTDAEVQAFVDTKMFTIDIPATLKITGQSLKDLSADKTDLETKVTSALGTFEVIKLGVASDNDYQQLAKDILGDGMDGEGGVVGAVQKYINDAKSMGKLTLQFTPSLVGTDTQDAAEWFSTYTTGWDTVNEFVKNKGAEIGKLLTTEEGKKIIESKPEILAALMKQVNDVTNAITGAQITSEAFAGLQVSIGDLDQASVQKIIDSYSDYRKQLMEREKELITQQYVSQGQLVAGLIAMGSDPAKEPLKSAIEQYKYMGEHINDAIEEGVESASKPGAVMIANLLKERYGEAFTGLAADLDNLGYLSGLENNAYKLEDMNEILLQWIRFNNADLEKTLSETGIYAWNVIGKDIKERIWESMVIAFGENATNKLIWKWESQTKEEIDNAMKEATSTSGNVQEAVKVQAAVDPDITVANDNEVRDKLRQAIDEAIGDGVIDTDEALTLMIDFGANNFNDLMEELGYQVSDALGGEGEYEIETDYNGPSSYPTSQTTYTPNNITQTGTGDVTDINVTLNESDISGGVQQGTAEGFRTLSESLSTVANWLQRIYGKELTVRYMPNTAAGLVNRASRNMVEAVTGEPES